MTLDEAKTIAAICSTADNGCSVCVKDLCLQLNDAFPQYRWTIDDGSYPPVIIPSLSGQDEASAR